MGADKNKKLKKVKRKLYSLYDYRCAYSGVRIQWGSTATIDHVRSQKEMKAKGLPVHHQNLLPCHRLVNSLKADMTLSEFRDYLSTVHIKLTGHALDMKDQINSPLNWEKRWALAHIGITADKPFDGLFYFEKIDLNSVYERMMSLELGERLYRGAYLKKGYI